ncbi:MAG: metallophosphoesterase [Candidatus Solibacter usitatus]|nr:metallophosphoesterase [Candidatus Solibacter usitatus]
MTSPHRRWIVGSLVVLLFVAVVGTRAVTEPKNDFRMSILGDRTGGATPEIYGRVWREVDLLHPDFVINVGDTIQGGKDEVAEAQWQELRPIWERYKHYPLYFTPGNHDVFSDTSQRVYQAQTGRPSYYSFNYQDAHFTVLDNSRGTELSEAQLKFLQEDLEANKDRRPKFVFFHKPYWLVFLKLGSGEFPLHQICKKYGVGHVISGHGHQFVKMTRDGIVYMEVGSSGGSINRGLSKGLGFKEGFFYHHVWGRVKGSKVELSVKELDGPVGKGRFFRVEEWDDNGPKFTVDDPAKSEDPRT